MAVHDITALENVAGAERAPAPLSRRHVWLSKFEHALGRLIEIPAALLVVAEVVILFIGVVARYGFHRPLIWSDELSSILFLWLAMLGAAVAFRRGEHMRMTALVATASPAMWAFLDLIATWSALALRPSINRAGSPGRISSTANTTTEARISVAMAMARRLRR